jgi:hypothetical protein
MGGRRGAGFSLMAITMGVGHPLVKAARWYEQRFGKGAHAHLYVPKPAPDPSSLQSFPTVPRPDISVFSLNTEVELVHSTSSLGLTLTLERAGA